MLPFSTDAETLRSHVRILAFAHAVPQRFRFFCSPVLQRPGLGASRQGNYDVAMHAKGTFRAS